MNTLNEEMVYRQVREMRGSTLPKPTTRSDVDMLVGHLSAVHDDRPWTVFEIQDVLMSIHPDHAFIRGIPTPGVTQFDLLSEPKLLEAA